jgi:hypothetical protein
MGLSSHTRISRRELRRVDRLAIPTGGRSFASDDTDDVVGKKVKNLQGGSLAGAEPGGIRK